MEQLEIEVKFFCANPDNIKKRILKTEAVSKGRVFETNTLYDRDKELEHRLCILRLRRDKKNILTFKAPVKGSDPAFKIVKETEVEVSDFGLMEQILESLDFSVIRKYEKWRETFGAAKVKILLDTMPFGVFLELEGSKENIVDMAQSLGLSWKKRIVLNYMQIFEIIRAGEGLDFCDLTFDLFKNLKIDINKYLSEFEAKKS